MANKLKMAQVHTIETLWKQGWSCRRIARELGVHRDTVRKYVRELQERESKPAKVTAGNSVIPPPGSDPKPAKVTAGTGSHRSKCAPYHDIIELKLETGLTAQRIYQDLIFEEGFKGSYESVKRYARRLSNRTPLPFRRMECLPGEQAQIDFGKGAPVERGEGRRRKRPWLFRITLSHSRKAYSEVVWKQTTENFLRCLENAFWEFGGLPETCVIDNLKAAVQEADWYDPELNPKIQAFAHHYGFAFLPTRPYTPRHKGKIERHIGYAQDNALKGRVFASLREQNDFLRDWERNVADQRIHGTTRKQVKKHFEEVERPSLKELPAARFPCFQEEQRKVHRDGHVEVAKAYYSVPPEYMGRIMWVRWDGRLVRIFNQRMEQVAVHSQTQVGGSSTEQAHIPSRKVSGEERGAGYLMGRIRFIGPRSELWARSVLDDAGPRGLRVLQGLLSLTCKHGARDIEQACDLALTHGSYRLKTIRTLLETPQRQVEFTFMDRHPLIREIEDYGQYAHTAFAQEEQP